MIILTADDEAPALRLLNKAIATAIPDAEVQGFSDPMSLMDYAAQHGCDVAFLDIEMREMTGLQLARRLKDVHPKANIVFVTGYSQYAVDAFHVSASDYLLKPASAQDITRAMERLRNPISRPSDKRVRVQTFGYFEVYVDGKPLHFQRSKAKELFAFLIDRQGASAKTADIAAVLWEDQPYGRTQLSNTTRIIASMMHTFRDAGLDGVIIKGWNSVAIDTARVECDYYEMLQGDVRAINAYLGEYMTNYSWAEMTNGRIGQPG